MQFDFKILVVVAAFLVNVHGKLYQKSPTWFAQRLQCFQTIWNLKDDFVNDNVALN